MILKYIKNDCWTEDVNHFTFDALANRAPTSNAGGACQLRISSTAGSAGYIMMRLPAGFIPNLSRMALVNCGKSISRQAS